MKMLNKIGPNMEPCGTPNSTSLKILSASIILTPCSLLFKNTKMLKLQCLIHMHEVLQ